MIYLLDTDTAILLMRGLSLKSPKNEKQQARQKMGQRIFSTCRRKASAGHVIGLSAITIAELEFGACRADDPASERVRMGLFLAPFTAFDFNADKPARCYGEVRSALESTGSLIGPNDLLIAAHALALEATLVTNNLREFRRVKNLECESWSTASR